MLVKIEKKYTFSGVKNAQIASFTINTEIGSMLIRGVILQYKCSSSKFVWVTDNGKLTMTPKSLLDEKYGDRVKMRVNADEFNLTASNMKVNFDRSSGACTISVDYVEDDDAVVFL